MKVKRGEEVMSVKGGDCDGMVIAEGRVSECRGIMLTVSAESGTCP